MWLAQLHAQGFRGGPAYYMQRGLGQRWMGVLFAVLLFASASLPTMLEELKERRRRPISATRRTEYALEWYDGAKLLSVAATSSPTCATIFETS